MPSAYTFIRFRSPISLTQSYVQSWEYSHAAEHGKTRNYKLRFHKREEKHLFAIADEFTHFICLTIEKSGFYSRDSIFPIWSEPHPNAIKIGLFIQTIV